MTKKEVIKRFDRDRLSFEGSKYQKREVNLDVLVGIAWKQLNAKDYFPGIKEYLDFVYSIKSKKLFDALIDTSNFFRGTQYMKQKVLSSLSGSSKVLISISTAECVMNAKRGKDWESFYDWLRNDKGNLKYLFNSDDIEELKSKLKSLKGEYYSKYGASSALKQFFKNYVTYKDKIKIISGFRWKGYGNDDFQSFRPICYKKCAPSFPECCSVENCRLARGEEINKWVERVISRLYSIRSKFVHEASTSLYLHENLYTYDANGKEIEIQIGSKDFIKIIKEGILRAIEEDLIN